MTSSASLGLGLSLKRGGRASQVLLEILPRADDRGVPLPSLLAEKCLGARRSSCSTHLPVDLGLTQHLRPQGRGLSCAHFVPRTPFLPGAWDDDGVQASRSQVAPFTYFSWLSCRLCHLSSLSFSAGGWSRGGHSWQQGWGRGLSAEPQPAVCTQLSPSASGQGGLS